MRSDSRSSDSSSKFLQPSLGEKSKQCKKTAHVCRHPVLDSGPFTREIWQTKHAPKRISQCFLLPNPRKKSSWANIHCSREKGGKGVTWQIKSFLLLLHPLLFFLSIWPPPLLLPPKEVKSICQRERNLVGPPYQDEGVCSGRNEMILCAKGAVDERNKNWLQENAMLVFLGIFFPSCPEATAVVHSSSLLSSYPTLIPWHQDRGGVEPTASKQASSLHSFPAASHFKFIFRE